MPDSLFDKLGDLLSEALDSGDIPQYEQAEASQAVSRDASAFFVNAGMESETDASAAQASGTQRAEHATHNAANTDSRSGTARTSAANGTHRANGSWKHVTGWAFKTNGNGSAEQPRWRRFLSEKERAAFRTLGIAENASYSEAKRLYHEKLQRFHPDKQGDNAVLQKIAQEKTTQFIAAWGVLEQYFAADKHK